MRWSTEGGGVKQRLLSILIAGALVACTSAPSAPATPARVVVTVIVIVTATSPPATATATMPPPTRTPLPATVALRPTTPRPSVTRYLPSLTATPSPRPSPTPSATLNSAERNPDGCLKYQFAGRYVGQQECISGTVVGTYDSGSAFFINYSEDRTSFYGVSFDFRWENLVGRCVRLRGVIETYRGRPEIIIRDPAQLEFCD